MRKQLNGWNFRQTSCIRRTATYPLLVSSLVCACYLPFFRRRTIETPHFRCLPAKKSAFTFSMKLLPFGGLTAMAARWIQLDSESRIHHVALFDQKTDPSPELVESAAATGGQVFSANSCSSILLKAAWLRDLARDHATYVVLHINVNDVIAGLAFGSPGGPLCCWSITLRIFFGSVHPCPIWWSIVADLSSRNIGAEPIEERAHARQIPSL